MSVDTIPQLGRWALLWRLAKQHRWMFLTDIGTGALFFIINIFPALAIREFFNAVEFDLAWAALLAALGGYVALKIIHAVMAAVWMAVDTIFRFRVATQLRTVLMTRLLTRAAAVPLPCPPGDALSRMREDALEFPEAMGKRGFQLVTSSLVMAIGALVVMLAINIRVTLLAVLPTLAVGVVAFVASKQVKKLREQNRAAAGDVSSLLREVFVGVEAVKLARAEDRVATRVRQVNDVRRHAAVRDGAFGGILDSVHGAVVVTGTGLVMLVAASVMTSGEFDVGDFALFVYNLAIMGTTVHAVGTFISRYQRLDISRARLAGLTPSGRDADIIRPPEPTPSPPLGPLHRLELRQLGYDHPDGTTGLHDINLTLHRGQITVITGRVGSGKTTLLRTLIGHLPPATGDITWNGQPLPVPLQPPHASYTPQTPGAVSETLQENILLGTPDDDRLHHALTTTTLDTDRLPDGIATQIGPRGHRLSGGQLHRLAAARMLAHDADLLVIDDLSAALDVTTEAILWQRILDEHPGRTALIVSNRRSVLRRAHHIIVMANGTIATQGPLQHVLTSSPDLQDLWNHTETQTSPP